ncbi:hypothetical protein BdWA1_002742 [Babesia duncani]|uniref:Vacuolar protein sorting-associated protein 51 homolog n=1 Tax=Babesia duncani TaxID=323732 RepID=A0AAD9PKK4_9APIC|nr:hypothetical protein BdWA1_002742 [Babesia duncani]
MELRGNAWGCRRKENVHILNQSPLYYNLVTIVMSEASAPEDFPELNENSDQPLSEYLLSYYDIKNEEEILSDDSKVSVSPDAEKLNETEIFDQEDLDVESHLQSILKWASISDICSLQRRLEREIRQLTAEKQILVYDNYGCLFSALDTVHAINEELPTIEKHLLSLKSTQSRATSMDLSSCSVIREGFCLLENFNRITDIFKSLSLVTEWILQKDMVDVNDDRDADDISNSINESNVLSELSILSKIYSIVEAIESECTNIHAKNISQLFASSLNRIVPRLLKNILDFLIEHGCNAEDLNAVAEHIRILNLNHVIFIYKIASKIADNKLDRLMEIAKDSNVSFGDVCIHTHEVIVLVHGLAFNILSQNNNELDTPETFCNCLFENYTLEINVDPGRLYSRIFPTNATKFCNGICNTNLNYSDFFYCYCQMSFVAILNRITDETNPVSISNFVAGLTGILVQDNLSNHIIHHWLVMLGCCKIQQDFKMCYKTLLEAILKLIIVDFNSKLLLDFQSCMHKVIRETIVPMVVFFKDLEHFVEDDIMSIVASFLIWCMSGIDLLFFKIYESMERRAALSEEPVDYLESCNSLVVLNKSAAIGNDCESSNKLIEEVLCKLNKIINGSLNESYNPNGLHMDIFLQHNINMRISDEEMVNFNMGNFTARLVECMHSMVGIMNSIFNAVHVHISQFPSSYPAESIEIRPISYVSYTRKSEFSKCKSHMLDEQFPHLSFSSIASIQNGNFGRLFWCMKTDVMSNRKLKPVIYDMHALIALTRKRLMSKYIHRSNRLIRFAYEMASHKSEQMDFGYRDLTVVLSGMLDELDNKSYHSLEDSNNLEMDSHIDDIIRACIKCGELWPAVNLYDLHYPICRDACLKIFVLHLVYAIHHCKVCHVIDPEIEHKLLKSFQQQILFLFKKGTDIKLILNLWGLISINND